MATGNSRVINIPPSNPGGIVTSPLPPEDELAQQPNMQPTIPPRVSAAPQATPPAAPLGMPPAMVTGAIQDAAGPLAAAQAQPGLGRVESLSGVIQAAQAGEYDAQGSEQAAGLRAQLSNMNPISTLQSQSVGWGNSRMDPKEAANLRKTGEEYSKGLEKEALAKAQKSADLAEAYDKRAQVYAENAAKVLEFREKQSKEEMKLWSEIKKENDTIETKLPRDSWMSSRNGFQKMLLYVASFLDGATGTDRTNQMIQQYTDREIGLQQEEYNRARNKLNTKWTLYKAFREMGNSDADAFEKSRNFLLDKAGDEILKVGKMGDANIDRAFAESVGSKIKYDVQMAVSQKANKSAQGSQRTEQGEDIGYKTIANQLKAVEGQMKPMPPNVQERFNDNKEMVLRISDAVADGISIMNDLRAGKSVSDDRINRFQKNYTIGIIKRNKLDPSAVNAGELGIVGDPEVAGSREQVRTLLRSPDMYDKFEAELKGVINRSHSELQSWARQGYGSTGTLAKEVFLGNAGPAIYKAEQALKKARTEYKGMDPSKLERPGMLERTGANVKGNLEKFLTGQGKM